MLVRVSLFVVAAIAMLAPLRATDGQQEMTAGPPIAASALAQIDALIAEKETRSPIEQKIDSQLIYEMRMRSGRPIASGVDRIEADVPYATDGHAVVDVTARPANNLAAELPALGAEILSSSSDGTSFQIHIAIERIESLAAQPDVEFIRPQPIATTSGTIRPDATRRVAGRDVAARAVASALGIQAPLANTAATNVGQGSRTSEGDITHLAFAARAAFGARGQGIKIGVLSDGVASLAASQAVGDLGPVTVLPGQAGSGDEGTAMLEIIHDLAPDAELFFATGFTSITTFADNIRKLRNEAHCDIIVDDVLYLDETPFQDGQASGVVSPTNGGVVIQAVKDVTASGALYFSSAGNSGNLTNGTSGVWEGDFADGGPVIVGSTPYRFHRFDTTVFNTLTAANTRAPVTLHWSDPLGASANDYDLFRLNAARTRVVAGSTNIQNGTQDPLELIPQDLANPIIIVVKKLSAASRFLHLDANGGVLEVSTSGAIRGHAAVDSPGAFGVAATPASGPFPNPFGGESQVEIFSSDGPRQIFLKANGEPIVPDGFLAASGSGKTLQKPDVTAADGVSVTGVVNFGSPFFGTSAAAPHAAAIAALIKSVLPATTADQLRSALKSTAVDIEDPGVDRDSGAGIIMATAMLRELSPTAPALAIDVAHLEASDNPGNGNGTPEPGEAMRLTIPLANYGNAPALDVTASLTSSTPGIIIERAASRSYGTIAVSAVSFADPVAVTIASDFPCPASASFTLTVKYSGGEPHAFAFDVPIGVSSYRVSKKLDNTTAAPSPGVIPSNGLQGFRLFRDANASVCGVAKPTPALAPGSGSRQFDAYAVNTCAQTVPSCVTVTLEGHNAINLFAAAYSPAFNPLDVQQNYKADAGASSFFRTFSFSHPGSRQPFAIDVHDVTAAASPSNTAYTLTVTGACLSGCDPNHVPVAKAKDVTVIADDVCRASASIDDGSFDADGDAFFETQFPEGPYSLGTTPVLLTATDSKGTFSHAAGSVTVVDKTAPVLACPAPIVVPTAPGMCSAPVTFAPTATDACSSDVTIVSTPASGAVFPLGTTTVATAATDAAGNTATCALPITVVDNEPPVINNLVLTQTSRSSSDREMVDVSIEYDQADNCPTATCVLSVTGGDTRSAIISSSLRAIGQEIGHEIGQETVSQASDSNVPSFIIVDAHHVRLSVDRSGRGNSRTYTITVTCTDSAGNQTVKSAAITVQRD